MHVGENSETLSNPKMGAKEQDPRRKRQDSLDNLIKQTIRAGESSVQWIQFFDSLDHSVTKSSKITKLEGGIENSKSDDCHKRGNTGRSVNGAESHAQSKNNGKPGKTFQAAADRTQPINLSEAVVAFAQAAAKANDIPGLPLMTPKMQVQKCGKCHLEFYSTLNYRRHTRMHRRSLKVEKEDLRKEREHLRAFWDKLSLDEASHIVAARNLLLEDLSGSSVARSLSTFLQQPGFSSLPPSYLKAGSMLLDIAQSKLPRFPLPSEELFSILDDSSEKTFLCGVESASIQRFIFEGDAAKVGLETKNLVASLGFLVEQKLVREWMADKDVEALRCHKALVEEEEAAKKRREKVEERKRLRKMRQKRLKGKEERVSEDAPCHIQLNNECEVEEGYSGNQGDENSPTATQSSPSSSGSRQDCSSSNLSSMDHNELEGSCNTSSILILDDKERFAGANEELGDGLTCPFDVSSRGTVVQESGTCRTQGSDRFDVSANRHEMEISQGKAEGKSEKYDSQSHHSGTSLTELRTNNAVKLAPDRTISTGWREKKRYDSMQSTSNSKVFFVIDRTTSGISSTDTNSNQISRESKRMYNLDLRSVQDDIDILGHSKPYRSPKSGHYRDKISGVRRFSSGTSGVHAVWTKKIQKAPISDLVASKEAFDAQRLNNLSPHSENTVVVDNSRGDDGLNTFEGDDSFVHDTIFIGSSEHLGSSSAMLSCEEYPCITAPAHVSGQGSCTSDIGSAVVIGSLSIPLGKLSSSHSVHDLEEKSNHCPVETGNFRIESGDKQIVNSLKLHNSSREDCIGMLSRHFNRPEVSSQVTTSHGTGKKKKTEWLDMMSELSTADLGHPVAGVMKKNEAEVGYFIPVSGSMNSLEGDTSELLVRDILHLGPKVCLDFNKHAVDGSDHNRNAAACSMSDFKEQSLKLTAVESGDSSIRVQEVEQHEPMLLIFEPETVANFLSKRWDGATTASAVPTAVPISGTDEEFSITNAGIEETALL